MNLVTTFDVLFHLLMKILGRNMNKIFDHRIRFENHLLLFFCISSLLSSIIQQQLQFLVSFHDDISDQVYDQTDDQSCP